MEPFDLNDIANKHGLSPNDRKHFLIHANDLSCALMGNITPTIARGAGALMELSVAGSPSEQGRPVAFGDVYQAASPNMRAAMDDLLAAYKEWLKLK